MSANDDALDQYSNNQSQNWSQFEEDVREAESLGDYWDACWDYIDRWGDNTRDLIDDLGNLGQQN